MFERVAEPESGRRQDRCEQLTRDNEKLRRMISELVLGKLGAERDPEPAPSIGSEAVIYRDFVQSRYMPFARATKKSAHWEEIILRCHLLPAFGDLALHEIDRHKIMALVQLKKEKAYSSGSINRMLSILKVTLNKAVDWELGGLTLSPARAVRLLSDPPKLERTLSPDEALRLMREIRASGNSMLRFIIPFLLFTGTRKREALDARWRDVDFQQRLWTIPVTKSGKPRVTPLSEEALQILRETHKITGKLGLQDWIFPNPDTQRPYVTIFHTWNRCRRAAGLADVRIHDLRHSFASALVNRGMTIYDVKEALGHANITTTQRYAHLSRDRLREAVRQAGSHYSELMTRKTDE